MLTKAQLVDVSFDELRTSKTTAKGLVEDIFEEVRLALEAGEPAKLLGFGAFRLRNKKQGPGRNPKTASEGPIMLRPVVTFHSSFTLKLEMERIHARYRPVCSTPMQWNKIRAAAAITGEPQSAF